MSATAGKLTPAPAESATAAAVDYAIPASAPAPAGSSKSDRKKWYVIHTYSGYENKVKANLERAYGLDQPLATQYLRYLSAIAHGDFGPSLKYRDTSVAALIAQGLPVSLTLGFAALLLALALTIVLTVMHGVRIPVLGAAARYARATATR